MMKISLSISMIFVFNPRKHMAITRELTIKNKLGIHARPAAQFVKTANRFTCDIRVEKDGEEVEGKSIMGLMMLAAGYGSVITVSVDGSDEEAAMASIVDLIERKFEED
jgi:phosphocarrier protein